MNKTRYIESTGSFITYFLPKGARTKPILIRFVNQRNLISEYKMSENKPVSPFRLKAYSRDESPDDPVGEDESSTPLASSFAPSSKAATISSKSGSLAMSRSTSEPFSTRKPTSRSNSRQYSRNPTNPNQLLKRPISPAFQFISCTIHLSHDENQIALEASSDDTRVQYANLQVL